MRNWKKILKKQLETGGDAGISRSGVDPGSIAFLLIQAVRKLGKPLVAAFPELKLADRAAAEVEPFRPNMKSRRKCQYEFFEKSHRGRCNLHPALPADLLRSDPAVQPERQPES